MKKKTEKNNHIIETVFLISFLLTISILRLVLYFLPETSHFFHDDIHHLYYGIFILMGIIVFMPNIEAKPKLCLVGSIIFGIAIGLIADEAVFLFPPIYGMGSKSDYFNLISLVGAIVCIVVVYIFREKILEYILRIKYKQKNSK